MFVLQMRQIMRIASDKRPGVIFLASGTRNSAKDQNDRKSVIFFTVFNGIGAWYVGWIAFAAQNSSAILQGDEPP